MKDQSKTKQVLLQELVSLRERNTELEQSESERKHAEEALLFTRFSLDNAADTMVCVQHDGHFIDVNDAFCRSVGYSREELLSMTVHDIDPTHPAEIWPEFWEKLKQAGSLTFESCHRTKEGKVFPVEITAKFLEYNGKEYHCSLARDITERKQAGDALHRSEQNFRRSLNDSPLGVRIVTIEGETIYANRVILDIYGYDSIEELKTTPVVNRYTPESFAEHQIRKEKRKRGDDAPSEYEIRIIGKDSKIRHLQVLRKEILWDGERQFQVIYQDITERKQAEEALRLSEEQYRTLFETMDEGFCVVEMLYDPDGKAVDYRFVEINSAFEKHTGLQQALGKTIRQMVPNHDAHWFEIYGKVARTGEAIRFENPAYAMQRYYSVFAFRIGGDGSQRVGILFNDITERKRAEEELQKSEELLNATQRLTKVGGWDWNVETQTMYWTEETYLIHDFVPGEMVPGSVEHIARSSECYDTEDRPVILAAFQRCVEEGQPYDFDFPFTSAKGRRLWIRTTAQPVLESGKIVRVIGNIMDITDRKRAEEEKRRVEERSRKVVEDIFRFIPEGVLVFSRKMELLRQNQAFRELVSGYARRLGFAEDELENLIVDKIKAAIGNENIKEIRISRKHETGEQT